jgi:NACHT domain
MFIVDDFAAWLIGEFSDEVRKRLTDWVLGTEQERDLGRVASAAIRQTATELSSGGRERAEQIAMVVNEVFTGPAVPTSLDGGSTILEVLQAGIAQKLAVLADVDRTGVGESWAQIVGLPPEALTEKLTGHVVQEILIRGARGGALTSLAAQLNADAARLQGQLTQDMIRRLTDLILSHDAGDVTNNLLNVNVYGNIIFLDTKEQTSDAREFEQQYRTAILNSLDRVELFGLDLPIWQRTYSLRTSYVDLFVNVSDEGSKDGISERGSGSPAAEHSPARVETVLHEKRRILLEGAAGSGKSSVLRHLAITALLGDQNGQREASPPPIPFLLNLRSLVSGDRLQLPDPEQFVQAVVRPLGGLKPDGWVSRLLAGGKALVLVDGVDEVREEYRRQVLEWLKHLVDTYPKSYYVLTSRDAAVKEGWREELRHRAFATARLAPLNPSQVDQLVTRWYKAMSEAGGSDSADQFDIQRLRQTLASRGNLTKLAATPLMCAIMCALSRNVHSVSLSRVDLYRTGLDLLLYRRDVARSIRAADWQVDPAVSGALLSRIGFWMLINSQEVIPEHVVHTYIADATGKHDQDAPARARFLQRVLEQTGLLELTPERSVVFRYPGFQDYLAAREVLRQDFSKHLVDNAHQARYRDVLIMAAGEAGPRQGDMIVAEVISRAQVASSDAERDAWILASECATARAEMTSDVRATLTQALRALLPPVSLEEAAGLAQLGEPLLELLIRVAEQRELTDSEVIATIRTVALIDVDRATGLLQDFKERPDPGIQRELVAAWFWSKAPERYAQEVLGDARLEECLVELQTLDFLPYLDHIRHLRSLSLPPETESQDLEVMAGLTNVRDRLVCLSLANTAVADFSALDSFPRLRRLDLTGIPHERRIWLRENSGISITG